MGKRASMLASDAREIEKDDSNLNEGSTFNLGKRVIIPQFGREQKIENFEKTLTIEEIKSLILKHQEIDKKR